MADVPSYPFGLKRTERLLDEAGFSRKGDGTRFTIHIDWLPYGEIWPRYGEYVRQWLRRIGIQAELRSQDLPRSPGGHG